MIRSDGLVKVLDFSLAKIDPTVAAFEAAHSTRTALSTERFVGGTMAYMSPEQATGQSLDRRSRSARRLTDDALVGARDHGVDPEYVRAMAALGYKGIPLDALIRMRSRRIRRGCGGANRAACRTSAWTRSSASATAAAIGNGGPLEYARRA